MNRLNIKTIQIKTGKQKSVSSSATEYEWLSYKEEIKTRWADKDRFDVHDVGDMLLIVERSYNSITFNYDITNIQEIYF